MKYLTLVRHAKSSWDDPSLRDFDRPLNARGRGDAPRMAARLAARPQDIDQLLSSPALRALQTAEVFAAILPGMQDRIATEPRIYDASARRLREVARELDNALGHVVLFGHNPGLSDFAKSLASCDFDEMPTCAIAQIELPIAQWREIGERKGQLIWFSRPKDDD